MISARDLDMRELFEVPHDQNLTVVPVHAVQTRLHLPTHFLLHGFTPTAGAQLAAYVALDPRPLEQLELSPDVICGVVPVSGAGYDLADDETYELGAERAWYEERFRAGDPGDAWLSEASAITYVRPDAPAFLLVHVTNEWVSLQHQNRLLHSALSEAGAESRLLVVKGQGHSRMVLTLSRGDKTPVPEILEFIRESRCF